MLKNHVPPLSPFIALIMIALLLSSAASAQDVVIDFIVEADSVNQAAGDAALAEYVHAEPALVGAAVGTLLEIGFEVGMQGDSSSETENVEFARLLGRLHVEGGESSGPSDYVARYESWSPEQRQAKLNAQVLEAEAVEARSAGDHDLALSKLDEAAVIYEAIGDTRALAVLWGSRGVVHFYRSDFAAMEEAYAQALPLRREIDDRILQGKTLNGMGSVHQMTDRYAEALDWYTQAVEIRRSTGDLGGLITSLTYRGNSQYFMGDLGAASESFGEAETLLRGFGEAGDPQRADLLNSQANVLEEMGDFDRALQAYQAAAELNERLGVPNNAVLARCNRAKLLRTMGRSHEAMDELSRSELLLQDGGDADPFATFSFYRIRSEVYWQVGDLEAARDDLIEARDVAQEFEMAAEELDVALGLCRLYCELGAAGRAYELAVRSAETAAVSELPLIEAQAWFEAGEAALLLSDGAEALQAYGQANHMYTVRGAEAYTLQSRLGMANSLALLERYPEARAHYEEILVQAADGQQGMTLVSAHLGLAHTYEEEDPALARKEYERALALLEQRRVDAGDLAATTFFVTEEGRLYQEITRYYAKQHTAAPEGSWAAEAFRVAESSKSRGLLDALGGQETAISGLSEVQGALAEGTLLLQYAVGDSASFVWAVDRDQFQLLELAPGEVLRAQVERLRSALATPGTREDILIESSRELYEILMAPIGTQLERAEELVIVPDGALYLLPFELLVTQNPPNGQDFTDISFLGKQDPISYAPSSSVWLRLRALDAASSASTLLALGDPDFSTLEGQPLEPLPHSAQEVERVGALVDADGRELLFGHDASETALRRVLMERRPLVLHLATHGLVDPIEPERSCVALTADMENDGYLFSGEIAELQPAASLVVLSACETATGRFRRGEGVVGLGRSFLASGAHGIVASLWPVSDESTAVLMEAFYEQLMEGHGAAASLDAARQKLMGQADYAHPFHWAAFILVGDSATPWGTN